MSDLEPRDNSTWITSSNQKNFPISSILFLGHLNEDFDIFESLGNVKPFQVLIGPATLSIGERLGSSVVSVLESEEECTFGGSESHGSSIVRWWGACPLTADIDEDGSSRIRLVEVNIILPVSDVELSGITCVEVIKIGLESTVGVVHVESDAFEVVTLIGERISDSLSECS